MISFIKRLETYKIVPHLDYGYALSIFVKHRIVSGR